MPDIAGAWAAIEARLTGNFTDPIAFENTDPPDPAVTWPPVDMNGAPVLWIFCEIVDVDAAIEGFGAPGSQTVMETGFAKFYVMVQKGSGLAAARAKAVAIGEAFRNALFYNSDPSAYVRTTTPRVGRDPMVSDDGNSVAGACCTVPYQFFHQA